jgi:hypothetical protein
MQSVLWLQNSVCCKAVLERLHPMMYHAKFSALFYADPDAVIQYLWLWHVYLWPYVKGFVWVSKAENFAWKSPILRGFLVRKRTIPTERPQPAGEVSANFSW